MNVIKWIRGWFRKPYSPWQPMTTVGDWSDWNRRMKLAKLHKDLDDCKKRLEAAVKAKKGGGPALRKELQEKKTQALREEMNG